MLNKNIFWNENKKDFDIIRSSIIDILFFSNLYEIDFYCFCSIKPDKLDLFLKNFENSSNFAYIFYISNTYSEFDNFLILGFFKKNFNYLQKFKYVFLNSKIIFNDKNFLINYFTDNINWQKINLELLYLKWGDQIFFCDFLDAACGGQVDFLPKNWGLVKNSHKNYSRQNDADKPFFDFILKNKLKINSDSKLLFINNFKK